MIKWLEVARSWQEVSSKAGAGRGDRETLARNFAKGLGINASSVRRCAVTLEFAEALRKAGVIGSPAELADISLEKLMTLQRIARLGMDEAVRLLPEIVANKHSVRELRGLERDLRARLAEAAAAKTGANTLISMLGGSTFRDAAEVAYSRAAARTGKATERFTGRGGFTDGAHLVARARRGGPFHAARIVPAAGLGPDRVRNTAIVSLAVAVSRVFARFDVIVQSQKDGEQIAADIAKVGPCGVGVLMLHADGTLEELHPANRATPPDLLAKHAADLDIKYEIQAAKRRAAEQRAMVMKSTDDRHGARRKPPA